MTNEVGGMDTARPEEVANKMKVLLTAGLLVLMNGIIFLNLFKNAIDK